MSDIRLSSPSQSHRPNDHCQHIEWLKEKTVIAAAKEQERNDNTDKRVKIKWVSYSWVTEFFGGDK